MSTRSWIQKNYLSFNGIRGVAILLVFYFHLGPIASPRLHAGMAWAGVDLFFVLSGFLITGILYEARTNERYFRDFYVRRALRILPVYWGVLTLILIVGLVRHLHLAPALIPDYLFVQNLMRRHIILNPAYINPIYLARNGPWMFPLALGTFWSLCVEEQFYLVWPFVMRFIPRRQILLTIALVGAGCVLVTRLLLFTFDHTAARLTDYVYYHFLTHSEGLLIGAALNLWLQQKRLTREALRGLSSWMFVTSAGVLTFALLIWGRHEETTFSNPVNQTVGYTLVSLVSAAILLRSLDDSSRLSRMLRNRWLQGLGRVSYGFYVIHILCPAIYIQWATAHVQPVRVLLLPVSFLGTYAVAFLSFKFYESPFLKLKERLAPGHRSVPSGSGKVLTS